MRTAEDIIDSISEEDRKQIDDGILTIGFRQQFFDRGVVMHLINEARRELLDELLDYEPLVDKQSILKLKDQIK